MAKQSKVLMGMPITVEIADENSSVADVIKKVFEYFEYIDKKFSTYKPDSEISLINKGKILPKDQSQDMKTVLALSQATKEQTGGYFDINHNGLIDPSGLVKGWAIYNAAEIIAQARFKNFYVEAGGDIEARGVNPSGQKWKVGIKNPFNQKEIIKVLAISGLGVATSGTYIRGQHIYSPLDRAEIKDIVSLTVVGTNVYEADRFATAAFAMGAKGINFIEQLKGFEGYLINKDGVATMTSGFENYSN